MSVSITATSALSENGFSVFSAGPPATGDFTIIDTEAVINKAINHVNNRAKRSIPAMTGAAGSKTASMSRLESDPVNTLITIMLRETKKTSLSNSNSTSGSSSIQKSVNMGPFGKSEGGSVGTAISATAAINNAANSALIKIFEDGVAALLADALDWSHAII
jgi:hypothetical protein